MTKNDGHPSNCGGEGPPNGSDPTDRLVPTSIAADVIGLKPNTLRKQRIYGGGCSYYKIGGAVRYSMRELERFKAARSHANTSEYALG